MNFSTDEKKEISENTLRELYRLIKIVDGVNEEEAEKTLGLRDHGLDELFATVAFYRQIIETGYIRAKKIGHITQ